MPKPLAYVGITVAISYWLGVAGFTLDIGLLVAIAARLGGIILGPIWFIWMGLISRRAGS